MVQWVSVSALAVAGQRASRDDRTANDNRGRAGPASDSAADYGLEVVGSVVREKKNR
ncbi:hypothetical protein [Halostagnicola sp. A56]|uniref:hypothetical protein n=1 Tax=Halostagnicola sp. A56 TaxID=1495067 RepID=UPI0012E110C0|nr:hypothetical protein [Halostagnicola sp. A56]